VCVCVARRYDMPYDTRYCAFRLAEGLAVALGVSEQPPTGPS
jgi:hypothetical protein